MSSAPTESQPAPPLYLDASAILRAVLETGTTPEIEQRIAAAPLLVTSRLTVVETARAMHRLRALGAAPETDLADAERDVARLLSECAIWELTREICDAACAVAPRHHVRSLDALHLATFVTARAVFDDLELLTADERMLRASTS